MKFISASTPSALARCAPSECTAAFGKPEEPEVSVSVASRWPSHAIGVTAAEST
ncbi:hypothetical protein YPPY13_2935, partial [Yersinia pestis PY-13]